MAIKKGQFIVFDVLLMVLFLTSTSYLIFSIDSPIVVNDIRTYDESVLLAHIINQQEFKNLSFGEDLSTSSSIQDWTVLENELGLLNQYMYLKISNSSYEKILFSCGDFQNLKISRDFIINNSSLEIRTIELGVCK